MSAGFTELYGANFHRLAVQMTAYLGDRAEAQDVTQEAFCRALDRWDRLSGYADPVGWVRRVAWNLATSKLRRYRVARHHAELYREEPMPGPSPDRVALVEALATLPPKHREAVVRHYLGQSTIAEIAEEKGVPEATVRTWLHRGRNSLSVHFAEFEQDEVTSIRPAGVDVASGRVAQLRRQRRIAGVAAVLLAVALLLPLTWFLLHRADQPPTNPTPTTSWDPVHRTIEMPGAGFALSDWQLGMVDASNGWALADNCPGNPYKKACRSALAYTADGGVTWHQVAIPANMKAQDFILGAPGPMWTWIDAQTMFLQDGLRIHLTKDRGTTWTTYEPGVRPIETEVGNFGFGVTRLRFTYGCTDAVGRNDPDPCQGRLERIGSGPAIAQPADSGIRFSVGASVIHGADGRVWLSGVANGEHMQIALSADDAKNWRRLADVPTGLLRLSHDGTKVIITGRNGLWRLDDSGAAVEVDRQIRHAVVMDDGTIAAVRDGKGVYLKGDKVFEIPGLLGVERVEQLLDGSIVFHEVGKGWVQHIGAGAGMSRRWYTVDVVTNPAPGWEIPLRYR